MNVLITGSSGFLGQNLIKIIKHEKPEWKIFGIDIKPYENQEINFKKMDLLKDIFWSKIIKRNKIDLIFHLAGVFQNVDNYTMMKINVLQTLSLLEDIKNSQINTNIILIGSAAQYGLVKTEKLPLEEDTKQKPISFYGLTKKWQEEIAIYYHKNYNIRTICTRPSNFIGKGITHTLLPGYLTKSFKEKKEIINLEISSKKEARDYIDIRDVSSALIRLSENEKCVGDIFNISSAELISNEDLINLFAEISGKKFKIKEKNKNSISKISISNEKIISSAKWDKKYTIQESIKYCLEED